MRKKIYVGWLEKSTKGDTYGYCKICDSHIRAQKNDLISHSSSKTHKLNLEKIHPNRRSLQEFGN